MARKRDEKADSRDVSRASPPVGFNLYRGGQVSVAWHGDHGRDTP